jgi:hypothetical protein
LEFKGKKLIICFLKKKATNISLDPSLKRMAQTQANRMGMSLSAWITYLIAKELGRLTPAQEEIFNHSKTKNNHRAKG